MQRPIFYISSVLIVTKGYNCPVYYVTTNAGVSCIVGFDNLPEMVQKWLESYNDMSYTYAVVSNSSLNVLLVSDVRVT